MKVKKKKYKSDYLNIDELLVQYRPIMASIYKKFSKFNNLFYCQQDYDDLRSQIEFEFVRLCMEYNPTRGVDFPGYIKLHLQQRVYHYITKHQKTLRREITMPDRGEAHEQDDILSMTDLTNTQDVSVAREFEKVIAMQSVNWDNIKGEKHRKLIHDIIKEGRTVEEIAQIEGVPAKIVRTRLHFVIERLMNEAKKDKEEYDET